jgi:hypothetical protein
MGVMISHTALKHSEKLIVSLASWEVSCMVDIIRWRRVAYHGTEVITAKLKTSIHN